MAGEVQRAPEAGVPFRQRWAGRAIRTAELAHPWFGPRDAFEGIRFPPVHRRIHVRRADRTLRAASS